MRAMDLKTVLDGIWASQLPLAERRRLAARAVACQLQGGQGGGHAGSSDAGGECQALAEVLAEVGVRRGLPCGTTTVSEAKAWLRHHGDVGKSLASRLGRLSKRRNAAAHPDGGLRLAVRALAFQHKGQQEQVIEDKAYFDKLKLSCIDARVSYQVQGQKEGVEHKAAKKQDESQALNVKNENREGTQKKLDAALAYFDMLKLTCVDAGVSYEEQVEKEEVERKAAKMQDESQAFTVKSEDLEGTQ